MDDRTEFSEKLSRLLKSELRNKVGINARLKAKRFFQTRRIEKLRSN